MNECHSCPMRKFRGCFPFWRAHREFPFFDKTGVNMTEKRDLIVLTMDMPGVKKENIVVEVEENKLSIKAKREEEEKTEEDKVLNYHFIPMEYEETVTLPESVDVETILAKYENGVLTISMQKKDEFIKEKKTVKIE